MKVKALKFRKKSRISRKMSRPWNRELGWSLTMMCIRLSKIYICTAFFLLALSNLLSLAVVMGKFGYRNYELSYDQLWASSLLGRNAVTWRWSLSYDQYITVDSHMTVYHYNDMVTWRSLNVNIIVRHFQPRVHHISMSTHYRASSV